MEDEQRRSLPITPQPPELRPPGSLPDTTAPARGSRFVMASGLVLLLGLAAAVVLLLPRYSAQQAAEPVAVQPPQGESVAAEPVAKPDANARPRAEQRLREFLQLRARLELANAPVWGEPEWGEAAAEVRQGDRLFLQNAFADADVAYRRAVERLHALDASRPQRLAEALRQGAQALAADEAADAVRHFEHALAIDADNAQAAGGLARAKVRERVLALMREGQQAEEQGELEAARAAYQQAAGLDAEYRQASAAQQRVALQIEQAAFRAAMGEAIQALEAGRYAASNQALQTAAGLRPGDDSVRDLRRRLDTARKQSALAEARRKARTEVAAEDWKSALAAYERALKVDPAAAFAVEGAKKARARLRLHGQIDHYLADPARLASDEPLANALRVLEAAGDVPAAEPRLASKLATLRQMVARAQTPVSVQLRSDGETDVVIYHVGHRGRFLQQQLELRPGTYTVVGSRAGYRDVRRQFVVKPGVAPPVVTIRCEEMI
jgi:tetratricopeptide (TPR) repeat protein